MNKMKIDDMLTKIAEKYASLDEQMATKAIKYLERVKAQIDAEIDRLKAKIPAPAATTTTSTKPTGFNSGSYKWWSKEGYASNTQYTLRLERIENDGEQIRFFFFDPTTGKRIYGQRMSNNPTTDAAKKVWSFDLKWIAGVDSFNYSLPKVIEKHRALYGRDYAKTVKVKFAGRNIMFVG